MDRESMGGRRAGLRVLCLRPKHSSDNNWKWNSKCCGAGDNLVCMKNSSLKHTR